MLNLYGLLFNAITSSLAVVLNAVDLCLVISTVIWSLCPRKTIGGGGGGGQRGLGLRRPSVVIVGGGFAGLAAQRELSEAMEREGLFASITLVDAKDYFEYTPGVLRLFVDPGHFGRLAQRFSTRTGTRVVQAEVTEVGPRSLCLAHPSPPPHREGEAGRATTAVTSSTLSFDYLLLCCGSSYPGGVIKAPAVVKIATTGRGSSSCHGVGQDSNLPLQPPQQPPPPLPPPLTLEGRAAVWAAAAAELKGCSSVLVIGGGPVGVELAAEFASFQATSPNRRCPFRRQGRRLEPLSSGHGGGGGGLRVTLVSGSPRLCASLPPAVGACAERWLRGRGVQLLLGKKAAAVHAHGCTLAKADDGGDGDDGGDKSGATELRAFDRVFDCSGSGKPNSGALEAHFASHLDAAGRLVVGRDLRVSSIVGSGGSGWSGGSGGSGSGGAHIFAAGDLARHPAAGEELPLGHTAELTAHVAARNIVRLARAHRLGEGGVGEAGTGEDRETDDDGGDDDADEAAAAAEAMPRRGRRGGSGGGGGLLEYPTGAHGLVRSPQVYCVSLGPHHGVLAFNGVVVSGLVPAYVKWLLEWTKVAACAERPVGLLFWRFADFAAAAITRFLLPVPEKRS